MPNGDIVTDGSDADINVVQAIAERMKAEVWLRKILATVLAKRAFLPSLEADPASRGGTFVEGESLVFNMRTAQAGQLLLLNLDARGRVTVLYPFTKAELNPLAADKLLTIPGEAASDRIKVTAPSGTDQLLALIFPQTTPVLGLLQAQSNLSVDHPDLTRLAVLLQSGVKFGAVSYTLRTLSRKSIAPGK